MASPVTSPSALSGWDGLPWAEYWQDQPALIVPRTALGLQQRLDGEAGWSTARKDALAAPRPDWSVAVELSERLLTVTDPSGGIWFQGTLLLTLEWVRAVYARGRLLLIAGEFDDIGQFQAAAGAGRLQLLVVGPGPAGVAGIRRPLPLPGGGTAS